MSNDYELVMAGAKHTKRWLALVAKRPGVFKVGDRVIVTDVHGFNRHHIAIGDIGTVLEVRDSGILHVRFDDRTKPTQYATDANIKKVSSHAS